jgi:hypothetical protein
MPNELPIPDEWQHLIEKRSGTERRSPSNRSMRNGPPANASKPSVDRRRKDRRKSK